MTCASAFPFLSVLHSNSCASKHMIYITAEMLNNVRIKLTKSTGSIERNPKEMSFAGPGNI